MVKITHACLNVKSLMMKVC